MNSLVTKLQNLFSSQKKRSGEAVDKTKKGNKKYALKDDSILKLLYLFVGPAVLGLLINALYNFIDRIFVGQFVGVDGLSAVTMVFPVTLFQFGFVLLFGSGAGILIAKYLGESKLEIAEDVLGNAIAGLLVVMVVFTGAGLLFYKPLLVLFGASGELLSLSAEYLLVIILGFPLSFFLAFEFTCRAEGNPRLPAILVIISCVVNVTLDYVFMKILNLGIQGAALATISAQAFNALYLISYYVSGKSVVKIVWHKIKIKKQFILPLLLVGTAPFLMDLAISFQNIFANHLLLQTGGSNGVAAMGILFGINVFFMMTALGTGDGMQPIISFNFGAKQYNRAFKTLEYALKFVTLFALIGWFILEVFPAQLTSIFIDGNEEVIGITKTALKIFAISIPFYTIQIVITRYFQALQLNKVATFLALLRPILLFVPIAYCLNNWYGLNGIWAAFPISDSLSAILSLILVKKYSLKKINAQ
ncbi:MATE family efflux transporter [Maribacter sp. Asnod1-A12]|uniref:MATE family efflux transporter n=1 Tax=Maribacter sp. Asnod1-A12 TaxID=3160576 RepID=UPI0038665160